MISFIIFFVNFGGCCNFVVTLITFLNQTKADTLWLGKGDERFLTITNHENVAETCGEWVTFGVLNVSDFVRTWVVLDVLKNTNTTNIVTTSNKNWSTVVELDNTIDFTAFKVNLDCVVLLDVGVGETDSTTVVGNNVWDITLSKNLSLDLAKLELGFFGINAMGLETTLNVVEYTEVFTSLVNWDNVLETKRELGISSDFVINLDVGIFILNNSKNFLTSKSVLESVTEKDWKGDALTELVGSSWGTSGVHAGKFIETPVGGSKLTL